MQEVVNKEIIKLLDTGIIYPIADSPWVSPIHCVPKKGGIIVVTNENDELVPTRTVTGWRVCIDYRKLNEATTKDHFPLPFMDQMLERLAGNKYFYFLDGFLDIFKFLSILWTKKKQYSHVLSEHTLIESVEVLMDDFSVFRDSFDKYLNNLDKMLQRCKDAHIVLNWEKCHFMVKEGIVLGHKVSGAGLEVDKAKINVISKLPPHTNIKETPFEFDDECQKAFKLLKEKLTCAPVIVSPKWNLSLELMCDASDFTVGAILEFDIEIKDRKGTENVAADHLSRTENDESSDDSEVDDNFPGETLMEINTKDEPCSNQRPRYSLLQQNNGKTMKRYGVNHRFSTSYHPQTSGQVKNTNIALKRILEKTVKDNPAIWSRKLDDALWAFRTAYKAPTSTTPYKLIYGKNCHLPF
ncbi:reverse transcriptase domain-containing protein [Tanacetum coccineum]